MITESILTLADITINRVFILHINQLKLGNLSTFPPPLGNLIESIYDAK